MNYSLKPYPAYRDSAVPSLGALPERWQTRSLASLTRPRNERGRPDLPLLSVVRERGVIPRSSMSDSENHNFVPDDLSNYKVARCGDLVVNKMKAWQGSLGLAPTDGVVSPAYFVYQLSGVNQRFAQALLRSKPYVALFARASDGVRIGQWDLSPSQMKRISVCLPPPDEQDAVVRFLDDADRRIRRYIGHKQELIRLLNEQRQSIIDKAVTRGLVVTARLKPSGHPWLGEVPAHWEVLPLRRRWMVIDCKHLTVPFVPDGIPLVSIREVQHFDIELSSARRTTPEWFKVLTHGGRQLRRGDLVYCRNVSVGAVAILATDDACAMGQDVCMIRSEHQNQRFLNYFLHSPSMTRQLALGLIGSTFNRINVAEVKNLVVTIPPRDEQDAIVRHLESELLDIDEGISTICREVELVREYRTRLVADVVTGKLDVRETAASLPDEPENLVEGSDALLEDVEGADESVPAEEIEA